MKTYMNERLGELKRGFLSDEIHRTVCENSPVSTVDFILTKDGGKSFCLITRVGNRWPDVKWFFGGRQRIGETLLEALARIASAEAGLTESDIIGKRFSHAQDVYNPASEPGSEKPFSAVHTVMHVYTIEVRADFCPTVDKTSKDPVWYTGRDFDCSLVPKPVIDALTEAELLEYPAEFYW